MSGWEDDDAVTITYRTLRQAQAEAAAIEQERIIKLLEDARSVFILDSVSYSTMSGLIALIKGKN